MSADATQAGDQEFEALIGPLVEPGLRLAFSMLGDRAEAEDATQEAITKAWRNFSRLRDRTRARPWFLTIVANQCRNVRRSRWFSTIRMPAFFQSSSASPETDRPDIEAALARLPAGDRQVLFMRFYLDLPIDEIGVALGISTAAAKGRVYRACLRLRPGLLEEDL